jgi:hypothetical protein
VDALAAAGQSNDTNIIATATTKYRVFLIVSPC